MVKIVVGNQYPIYKATTEFDYFMIMGSTVIYSRIQGFVPAFDIIPVSPTGDALTGAQPMTMIANQISVGRALYQAWMDDMLFDVVVKIRRVSTDRTAPYEIAVLMKDDSDSQLVPYEGLRNGQDA